MRWRSRSFTGAGIAAVAAWSGLTLTGCSSHSGDQAKKQPTHGATASANRPGAAPSTTGTGSTSASPTATGGADQGAGGVWLAMQGSTKVQLVLGKGRAALTSTSLCGGTYTEHDGVGLVLVCMDGNKDRTRGHGDLSADGKTLTVRWSGGITDMFSRTGLPSS